MLLGKIGALYVPRKGTFGETACIFDEIVCTGMVVLFIRDGS